MRSLPPLASLPTPSHQQRREKINHRNVPPLNQARKIQKQTEIEKSKVRIIAPGGGRKPEMSPKEGVCLCLVSPCWVYSGDSDP
ncbi:MAG: hypothetical protein ACYTXM_42490, partial [Nostoc sp.]